MIKVGKEIGAGSENLILGEDFQTTIGAPEEVRPDLANLEEEIAEAVMEKALLQETHREEVLLMEEVLTNLVQARVHQVIVVIQEVMVEIIQVVEEAKVVVVKEAMEEVIVVEVIIVVEEVIEEGIREKEEVRLVQIEVEEGIRSRS